jgi:acetyl esterase/lipase
VHFATLLVMLLMHVISPNATLNVIAPKHGTTLTGGIAYGDGPRRQLDVYAPDKGAGSAPVVVFFYGGGWETGARSMYRFVGYALAAHGVVVAIPDYRLHPEVQFPAFMEDAAAAVAWVHANAARFRGDPHKLFLMGHSAGAQIATLLAMDPEYLRSTLQSPESTVCGVIGLAGPYDFLPFPSEAEQAVFGPEISWPRSQPINYASSNAPPMLLLAGQSDRTVDPGNTSRLADRLRDKGALVRDELYPDVGHIGIIAAVSGALNFVAPVLDRTLGFIRERGVCGG